MRYAYTGETVPPIVPTCVYEGWLDARIYGPHDNLYRYPFWKKIGWETGCRLAKF